MDQKARTKDEKFMWALYEATQENGDVEAHFDRYEIGNRIGLHPRGVDTICTLLLQANFIKKGEGKDVYLTPHGFQFLQT